MNKYRYTFEFVDTIEQAKELKKRILERFKNNKYYMSKYANKISYGHFKNAEGVVKKVIIWYFELK